MKLLSQKILSLICTVGVISAIFTATIAPSVSAAVKIESRNDSSACGGFLGFTSWDCGLQDVANEDDLRDNIWLIASNIAVDISVAAAYLVLGFVIYGGYQYTFSNGDPGKVANGKKILAQAFIGLAITMSANIIMGSIRIALVGDTGNIGNCVSDVSNGEGCTTPDDLVYNLVSWVITIAGIVSAIFLVFGGIQYITASGDPGKVKKAKDMILYSLIGLVIVALASIITAFVSNVIREANNTAVNQNNIIISKEVYENQIY